jgi:hemoglobin-like flavoprotein
MNSIIIDASLDKELLEKGFAIIPILNGEDTNLLHQFYLENHHSPVEEMYASAHSKDLDYRMKMSNGISSIVVPHLT